MKMNVFNLATALDVTVTKTAHCLCWGAEHSIGLHLQLRLQSLRLRNGKQ